MTNKVVNPKWLDSYTILKPEDEDLLSTIAAQHEFRGGHIKEEAEQKAYEDYLRNHALDSAAHHYIGMRAAIAANNTNAAKQHGVAFAAAMNHLGHNPVDVPPKEIMDRVKDIEKNPYKFIPHSSDVLFEQKTKEEPVVSEQDKTKLLLSKLQSLKNSKPN